MSDISNRPPKVIAIVKRNDEGQLVLSDGERFERGDFVTLFPALDGVVLLIGEAGPEESSFVHELVKAKMWETRGFALRGFSGPSYSEATDEYRLAFTYLEYMEEVKKRISLAEDVFAEAEREGPSLLHYEFMGLHLRKTLELIAFASLVANKERYAEVYQDFQKHWNAKRLLSNLHKINVDFYPRPVEVVLADADDFSLESVTEGYLTQDEFVELYGHASEMLHVKNPFRPLGFDSRYSFSEWIDRVVRLLSVHQMRLVDTSKYWIVQLASAEHNGRAMIADVKYNDL